MTKNRSLAQAKSAKKDEFYTQLPDIENELRHYAEHFRGKTVFCNCDDPYESNFFKFFAMNFNLLGLKKLIATSYAASPVAECELPLFEESENSARTDSGKTPYQAIITEVKDENGDGRVDLADVEYLLKNRKNVLAPLKGDGDFRSAECVELLKQADIVVTNPPFSLFREYVAQLVEYGKKFLIIGNMNAISYKEIFPLIQNEKIWLGYKNGDMAFTVPDYYEERSTRYWVDGSGRKWRSMGNIAWFTNLDMKKRHEKLILFRHYAPEEYPRYDNYDAIEVGKIADIPRDYDGVMGVPITFLDKFCPEQFEILDANKFRRNESVPKKKHGLIKDKESAINGNPCYVRILIRNKFPETANSHPQS